MKIISNTRIFRSQVTPSGIAQVTRELDFDLGPRMAIELLAVLGLLRSYADSSVLVDPVQMNFFDQSLHAETGTLEDQAATTVDEDVKDSEFLFHQHYHVGTFEDQTNGTGGASVLAVPNGIVHFPEGIVVPTNITHRAEVYDADISVCCEILLYYRYVEIEDPELAMLLAYRGR